MKYYVVAALADLELNPQMHVDLDGKEILLCRDGEEYFAISYYCTHAEFTLEGGLVKNASITCPYHGAEFDLRTGEALSAPAFEPVRIYPLMIEDGTLAIGID